MFGGYLLFFAGSRNLSVVAHLPKFPDISYGLYLYGWPVVCLIIWKLHSSPGTTFILSSNQIPAGATELPRDQPVQAQIRIDALKPGQ